LGRKRPVGHRFSEVATFTDRIVNMRDGHVLEG
jgi:ABC-type sugar transport system ATPase subunit